MSFIKKVQESKNEKRKRNHSEGFTFVETLGVLAIGAVLTAGTTVSVSKLIGTAKRTAARNQIEQYYSALQSYFLDCGRFPTSEQGIEALWTKPTFYPIPETWDGPYLEKKPAADPWGQKFIYISAESSPLPIEAVPNLPFAIICYGADGKEGGEGNNADLYSWE